MRRGGPHSIPTHRLALILDGHLPGPGQVARRTCRTPLCVNPRHLTWGTQVQNVEGRQAKGEGNGRAVLTRRGVLAIRAAPWGHGSMSASALARAYGVHVTTIRDILAHKIWRDVPAGPESNQGMLWLDWGPENGRFAVYVCGCRGPFPLCDSKSSGKP